MLKHHVIGTSLSRRDVLRTAGAGFGYLALAGLLGAQQQRQARQAGPLAPKPPHFPAKAKRIIFLFMEGAMSQMDTCEYKAQLQRNDSASRTGRRHPDRVEVPLRPARPDRHLGLEPVPAHRPPRRQVLLPPRPAHRHAGPPAGGHPAAHRHRDWHSSPARRWVRGCSTAWAPKTRTCPATSRSTRRPNFGGAVNYGTAFLPAHFQGTRISDTGVMPEPAVPTRPVRLQRRQLDLIQAMNRDLAATPGAPEQLDGVIQSLRAGLPHAGRVPDLLDISREPQAVLDDAYGVKPGPAGSFARQCLMARRLSEAGVPLRRDHAIGLGPSQQPAPRA